MDQASVRSRAVTRCQLRLETLEDRLPPGQAAPLATAVVAGPGAVLAGVLDDFVPSSARAPQAAVRANLAAKIAPTVNHKPVSAAGTATDVTTVKRVNSEKSPDATNALISASEKATTTAGLDGIGIVDLSAGKTTSPIYFTAASASPASGSSPASRGETVTRSSRPESGSTPAPAARTPAPAGVSTLATTTPPMGPAPQAAGPSPSTPPVGSVLLPQFAPLTTQNRNSPSMTGGWNPALRSVMIMDDGSRWFAAETGGDVQVNSSMVYYKFGLTGWRPVGSVMLPAGIQQNMATITNGRVIYSYGCTRTSVIETYFDTTKPGFNRTTSNAITAGGVAITPGREANYVGAAWHDNTRVVWWTTVGANGSGGTWSHAFNSGRGWNGPVTVGLGGYSDVGYVRAQFDERNRLHMIGEAYSGAFPAGGRYLVTATLVLGNACQWVPIFPAVARSPLDLWREDGSVGTQFLYRVSPTKIGYSFGPKGAPKPVFFNALEARFISDADHLALVTATMKFVEVRIVPRSAASAWIDWNAVPALKVPLPKTLQSAGVSAIWNVDSSRQPHEPPHLEFAICGGYPARDNLIYEAVINPV
jgi:hypothetical protein